MLSQVCRLSALDGTDDGWQPRGACSHEIPQRMSKAVEEPV